MFKRAGILAVAGAVALGIGLSTASAADWPKRPITMVVPYKAGGTTETMGQVLSKALGRELGTKVIVKTKPGGGSAVGSVFAKNQKPDGYTILFVPLAPFLWNPLGRKMQPMADGPICLGSGPTRRWKMLSIADGPVCLWSGPGRRKLTICMCMNWCGTSCSHKDCAVACLHPLTLT